VARAVRLIGTFHKVAKLIESNMVECVGPVARKWEILRFWFVCVFPKHNLNFATF
jgi:hypothetical protein